MKTNQTDIIKALALWIGILSLPVGQRLIPYDMGKHIIQYLVYPLVIMAASRTGRFWVNKGTIITSTAVSAIVIYLYKKYVTPLKDDDNQYLLTSTINILIFSLIFFLMGAYYKSLYTMSNFNV